MVITRGDGTRALVVQDYAFAKYLGFLQVGLLNPLTAMMSKFETLKPFDFILFFCTGMWKYFHQNAYH